MEELEIEIGDIRHAEHKLQEVLNDIKDIAELDEVYDILDGILNNDLSDMRIKKEIQLEQLEEENFEYDDDFVERSKEYRQVQGF